MRPDANGDRPVARRARPAPRRPGSTWHFGGMPRLSRAVRQEGFTAWRAGSRPCRGRRTRRRPGGPWVLPTSPRALADPFLYRAMFDAVADLEDPDAADAAFRPWSSRRPGRCGGRLHPHAEPLDVATRFSVAGHRLALLAVTGVLFRRSRRGARPRLAVGVLVAAGADPARCRASVAEGWPRGGPTGGG